MSRRARVNAVGYYAMGNFGDELFARIVRTRADELWPNGSVRTFAPGGEDGPANRGWARLYSRMDAAGTLTRAAAAGASTLWADTFSFCGGSVLTHLSGTTRLRTRVPGRRLETLGVSVGPWPSGADEAAVSALLGRFDRLVVRDEVSAQRCRDHGRCDVILGGDLAALAPIEWFTAPAADHAGQAPAGPRLVICPSAACTAAEAEAFAGAAASAAVQAALHGRVGEIVVLGLNDHPALGDQVLCTSLTHRIRSLTGAAPTVRVSLVGFGTLGVSGVLELLAGADAVWTARLHAAVVAYLAGVPFLLAGHHEKCRAFASDIGLDPRRLLGGDGSGLGLDTALDSLSGDCAVAWPPDAYRTRAQRAYLGQEAAL